jgi:hypothetical protein
MAYKYDPLAETQAITPLCWDDEAHPLQNLDYLVQWYEGDHGDR